MRARTTAPRAYCEKCWRHVALKDDGTYRKHYYLGQGGPLCPNSGQRPRPTCGGAE